MGEKPPRGHDSSFHKAETLLNAGPFPNTFKPHCGEGICTTLNNLIAQSFAPGHSRNQLLPFLHITIPPEKIEGIVL